MNDQVLVNGTQQPLAAATSVADLVTRLGVPAARGVAVAVNGAVVLRSEWARTPLSPGDRVEVLVASQGG